MKADNRMSWVLRQYDHVELIHALEELILQVEFYASHEDADLPDASEARKVLNKAKDILV